MERILASPGYPFAEAMHRDIGRRAYDRDPDVTGVQRQNAAVLASPDRRAELAALRLPVLVIHGSADVMIRPAGGAAIAAAVPGARSVTYPGMGHDLPVALWNRIAGEIARLAALPQNRAARGPV
jgi:pimeloyl-ACP methyl ester carboxylesterase